MSSTSEKSSKTSKSLIQRAAQNEPYAWEQFVDLYAPLVHTWISQRRIEPNAAADIVQDVFSSVHRSLARFSHSGGTFRGWLWTITRNKIRDHFRRLARSTHAAGGSTAQMMLAQIAEDESLSACDIRTGHEAELAQALETIQAEVQPSTWKAFWRTTIEGVDSATIAEELGISTGAVRVNRFRVLKRLRELLSPYVLDQAGLT